MISRSPTDSYSGLTVLNLCLYLQESSMDRSKLLPNVNLKLLNAFMLVAENNSFRKAADSLHRSQSAITSQIKQLESQLDVKLFHRTTRQVTLTSEGEYLLECAYKAIHEVERGLRHIRETVDIRKGRISISCSSTVSSTKLTPILATFEREYPEIEVFVQELTSVNMFETVRKDEVDFAIGPVVGLSEFDFEPVLTENLYALVPDQLFSTVSDTIPLSQLNRLPLLLLNPDTALRALIEKTAQDMGMKIKAKFQFSQAQTLLSMADAGLGAAVLPDIVIPKRLNRNVRKLLIVDPCMSRQIAIVTRKGQSLSPAPARLAQIVRKYINSEE